LKRVILTRDWVGVAKRASPSLPGQGTNALNMYSFVQFCTVWVIRQSSTAT